MSLEEIFDLNDEAEISIKHKNYSNSINLLNKINEKLSSLSKDSKTVENVSISLKLMILQNNNKISDLQKVLHKDPTKSTKENEIKKKDSVEFVEIDSLANDNQDIFQMLESLITSIIQSDNADVGIDSITKGSVIRSNKCTMEELIIKNYQLKQQASLTDKKLLNLLNLIKFNKKTYLDEVNNLNLKNKKLINQLDKLKSKWNDLIESARKRRDKEKELS